MKEKQLVIISGPNGSGKTTFALEYAQNYGFKYLGADAIAAELSPDDWGKVKVKAGKIFLQRLDDLIETEQSVIVESTLSGLSFQRVIKKLKASGYTISVIFVFLDNPEICIARIKERVLEGGHHVPDDDVRRRFYRSIKNFWGIYKNDVDSWGLFYNSNDNFQMVAGGKSTDFVVTDESLLDDFLKR